MASGELRYWISTVAVLAASLSAVTIRATVPEPARLAGSGPRVNYGIKQGDFCPSRTLIQRACEVWGIEFNFRNLKIAKGTLSSKRAKAAPAPPTQLELFEALRPLQNQTAQIVETKRMGRAVELTLRFEISA
jgi:hypothetical protein